MKKKKNIKKKNQILKYGKLNYETTNKFIKKEKI